MKTVSPLFEIIEGCKHHNRLMQKQLYQLFSGKMYAVCLRYTKDADEAKDVLQTAFIKIFKHIDSYQAAHVFEAWLKKIVVNTAIDFYRKNKRTQNIMLSDDQINDENLAVHMECNFSLQVLLQYINELPDGFRMVFNLYVMEGFSHKEIAAALQISESTSKSQLSRARNILQQKIKIAEEVAENYGA